MKHLYNSLLPLAALFVAAGCKNESQTIGNDPNDGILTIVLETESAQVKSSALTGAGTVTNSFPVETGSPEHGMLLVETVSPIDVPSGSTRSTIVDNSSFDSAFGNDIYATAFVPGQGNSQLSAAWGATELGNAGAVRLSKDPNSNRVYTVDYGSIAPQLQWPSQGSLLYFLQAPYSNTSTINPAFHSDGHIEFDLSVSTPASQTDILFGSFQASAPIKTAQTVTLFHSLAAVEFLSGNKVKNTVINSITVKQIRNSGHCVLTPASGMTSAQCAVWSSLSGYMDLTSNSPASSSQGNYLMVIPQTGSNVEVQVNATIDGVSKTYSTTVNIDWKAGQIHTYSIDVYEAGIEVTDQASGLTNTNARLKNTGNYPEYMRAAIVTTWNYGESGSSIAVAASTDASMFTGLCGNDSNGNQVWVKGDDGFYYYLNPVRPGQSTLTPLFTQYTAPDGQDPFPGAHMEMQILGQCVICDSNAGKIKVTQAWGAVKVEGTDQLIVDRLSTTPENQQQ